MSVSWKVLQSDMRVLLFSLDAPGGYLSISGRSRILKSPAIMIANLDVICRCRLSKKLLLLAIVLAGA